MQCMHIKIHTYSYTAKQTMLTRI